MTTATQRIDAVLETLIAAGQVEPSQRSRDWRITQLAGGWSRHTYQVTGCDRSYVIRVKPPGSLLDTDLEREYLTHRALGDTEIPLPRSFGVNTDPDNPFGGPYFVMGVVSGSAPSTWQRADRDQLESNWSDSRSLGTDLVHLLTQIHEQPTTGFTHLGEPLTFEQVVNGWQTTFEKQRLVRDPVIDEAFTWVRSRPPDPVAPAVVHGDYRIGNAMLVDDRISAVMDWELSYLGDPRFDLGYVGLDYLAGSFVRRGSELLCAVADRDWFYAEYERRTGRPVDREVVRTYAALGALALLTILHTGVRMYSDGRTDDARLAWTHYAIPGLRLELTKIMRW